MAGPRTVLVVDDSATTAKQLIKILDESGRYKVVAHAGDGLEALKLVKMMAPEVVCLDVVMPNMDGIQALRMIKAIKSEIRVVMITSVAGSAEKVAECLKAGASNVVSKPFDAKKVLDIMDKTV
jgi:two-component system chemotaxis response regulator CheY